MTVPREHMLCCDEYHAHKAPNCCAPDCWCGCVPEVKHTPGELMLRPVQAGDDFREPEEGDTSIVTAGFYCIGIAWKDISGGSEANARRLVACWNACQGLSTEALEAGALGGIIEIASDATGLSLDTMLAEALGK